RDAAGARPGAAAARVPQRRGARLVPDARERRRGAAPQGRAAAHLRRMMPPAIAIRVPAKVNLFLRVVARRPDGYHEVETVLQSIALFDTLELSPAPELQLACDRSDLPVGEANLVWQAAAALRGHFRLPADRGASMTLRKSIPVGAGLGGGSADAAAALVGLGRLWNLDAPAETLRALA